VSPRSADSVETRADQAGQLSGMAIYHQSAGANQVAILTVEPPSTQQSTRNVAHKNTPPSTSRWLDNTLRRRAGSRSAGPARTRSGLHASEIRAAGPTNRVGNISDDQGEGQARAPAGYCDKRHDDRASIARGRWHEHFASSVTTNPAGTRRIKIGTTHYTKQGGGSAFPSPASEPMLASRHLTTAPHGA
jgi:hypothetical protein